MQTDPGVAAPGRGPAIRRGEDGSKWTSVNGLIGFGHPDKQEPCHPIPSVYRRLPGRRQALASAGLKWPGLCHALQRAIAKPGFTWGGLDTSGLASKPWHGRPSSANTCCAGIMRDLKPSNLQLYGSLGSQLVAKNRHFQQFTGTVLTKVGKLGMPEISNKRASQDIAASC